MMIGHHLRHHFNWALVIKALAGPNVELIGDRVQLFLAYTRQIDTFEQVLAYQTVDVFVTDALPRAVRIAEIHSHVSALSDFCMTCHFPALVVSERFTRS